MSSTKILAESEFASNKISGNKSMSFKGKNLLPKVCAELKALETHKKPSSYLKKRLQSIFC